MRSACENENDYNINYVVYTQTTVRRKKIPQNKKLQKKEKF